MAYGEKYKMGWSSLNRKGHITISEKNYTGSLDTTLNVAKNSLSVTVNSSDWDSRVLGKTCEFDIINDKDDFFTLFNLLYTTERKYLIRVTDETGTLRVLFEGYINTDVVEQKYLKFANIKIVASSYLSKLEYITPPIVNDIQPTTFIAILNSALKELSTINYNIRVRIAGKPIEDTLTTKQTVLNTTGINTEFFWENNVDKMKADEIVKEILKTFNAYLYWKDGYWYIEDFVSIWETTSSKTYVEYDYNVLYLSEDEGTLVSVTSAIRDVQQLQFTETTQTIKTVPGNKTNKVELQEKKTNNLVFPDWRNVIDIAQTDPTLISNKMNQQFFEDGVFYWEDVDAQHLSIEHSKKRVRTTDVFTISDFARGSYFGMNFSVRENTKMKINWKWNENNTLIDNPIILNQIEFLRNRIYIRLLIPSGITGIPEGWYYLTWAAKEIITNNTLNKWLLVSDTHHYNTDISVDKKSDEIKNGSYVWQPSVSLDTNNIYYPHYAAHYVDNEYVKLPENNYFAVLGILTASFVWPGKYDFVPPITYIGDVTVTEETEELDNLIEGKINTDFLNEATINLKIFDLASCLFKNGILRDVRFELLHKVSEHTQTWYHPALPIVGDIGHPLPLPIAEIRLVEKVRQTNTTRQIIIGTVTDSIEIFLFSLFVDSAQSNLKFVVTSIRHLVDSGRFELELREYDNETIMYV